jgi:SAM-dependent methyltransferase
VFTRRAERRREAPSGPSFDRAWEALVTLGSVLDVGAGAGAACLPLAPRATAITAVDSDATLLSVLVDTANGLGTAVSRVEGRWPDIAGEVALADVVTCHHVLYNVPDFEPFVAALTNHARRRVVVEITSRHPLTSLNPLWERFHGLRRPDVPIADQALEILTVLGLTPSYTVWTRPHENEYASFDDLVEVTRRRLCLDVSRAGEVASALRELGVEPGQPVDLGSSGAELVTIWWDGSAR